MKCKRPLSILLTFVMLLALLPAFALPVRADAAVRIDAGNFPDPVFREYVEKKCDGDSDGLLSESEIAAVKKIEIREDSLVSVQGIEFFTALEKLSCGGQWDDCGIAVVDLSRNTALTELSIFLTQITALDLSRNTALEKLWCASNFQLEALDISGCSKLIRLETYWTKLTELDISACPAIIGAYLAGSQNSIRPSWLMGDEPEATYPYYWEYKSDEGYLTVNKEVTVLTDRQPAVSFDANGGSGEMAPVKVEKGSGYILPECAFTPPEGWEFDRWDKGEAGLELVIASDTTLTAQWKKLPVPCTVSFDPDGGSGEMESLTVETGGSVVLPECAFTPPEGMEFDGWALGAPGTVVVIEADTAVKALWKAIPLDTRTVIFDAGGGSGEMASVTVEKGKNYTLPECAFTAPEGKEFDQWNKGEAGEEIVIETDTAIVALWKDLPPKAYTVSFDAAGGVGEMEPVTVEIGKTYRLPACGFTAPEGMEFDAWAQGAPGERIEVSGDMTVTAVWKEAKPVSPFEDVPETAYFYDAVMWAYYAEPQVTNGIDATHFGPFNTVTRGQAVTFLWRAMGCPEPESTVSPFEDVTEGKYFYKAVLWAVEKGVTNGTDKTHFTPNQTCSTAHILTFLYRTMGVGVDGWYEIAEAWAKGAGLLEDLEIKVAPGVECPRCDVVLFLCRALAE